MSYETDFAPTRDQRQSFSVQPASDIRPLAGQKQVLQLSLDKKVVLGIHRLGTQSILVHFNPLLVQIHRLHPLLIVKTDPTEHFSATVI